jgi:DNA-binding IclR family transcriptional regulator
VSDSTEGLRVDEALVSGELGVAVDSGAAERPAGVQPIQAIQKAVAVLNLFTSQEPELTLAEIADRLGMSRATTYRYLMTLRGTNLLAYDATRGVYALGVKTLDYAEVIRDTAKFTSAFVQRAEPVLRRLSEETDHTAVASVWSGDSPVLVRVGTHVRRMVVIAMPLYSCLPVFDSAQGRVFLAFSAEARRMHASDPRFRELESELERVHREGFASHDVSAEGGMTTLAVPVLVDDTLVGVIASLVFNPVMRESERVLIQQALKRAAAELAARVRAENGERA